MAGSSSYTQPSLITDADLPAPNPRAFTKWPGGKRELASSILLEFPEKYGTYFEPFCGAAAVFFAAQPTSAILGDKNESLINAYECVKNNYMAVSQILDAWSNSHEEYYRIRGMTPTSDTERAAKLLYLTQLSFNGIYRENLKGAFNVPYGQKTHLSSPSRAFLAAVSNRLKGATFRQGDFESCVEGAMKGDLVYFDPPYTVAHNNNGFVKYNAHIFSWEDQQRVAKVAEELRIRGCHVIISNADHLSVRGLYPNFRYVQLRRPSRIAASAMHRQSITEALFIG